MGSYLGYEPKFSNRNVNYSVAPKCKNDFAMRELIQSTWKDIVAKIPAEPQKDENDNSNR